MDNQRQSKSDKYHQKKQNYQRHDKTTRLGLNEQQANLLEAISQMAPHELYKFMTNKFDKIIDTNQKLLPKIYTAVSKRLGKFIPELVQQQKQKFVRFVKKHTGYSATAEDMKEIFQSNGHHYRPSKMTNQESISYLYVKGKKDADIYMVRVMKLEPKQQISKAVEKFYISGIKQDIFSNLDIKRFKKDCASMLQEYLAALESVEAALQQE